MANSRVRSAFSVLPPFGLMFLIDSVIGRQEPAAYQVQVYGALALVISRARNSSAWTADSRERNSSIKADVSCCGLICAVMKSGGVSDCTASAESFNCFELASYVWASPTASYVFPAEVNRVTPERKYRSLSRSA